jgi:hypothetical protein
MGVIELLKGASLMGASAAIAAFGVDSGLNLIDGASDNELTDIIKTGASVVGTTVCVSKGLEYLLPQKSTPAETPELDEVMSDLIESEEQAIQEMTDVNQQLAFLIKQNQELAAQVKELEAAATAKKTNSKDKKSAKVDLAEVEEANK